MLLNFNNTLKFKDSTMSSKLDFHHLHIDSSF